MATPALNNISLDLHIQSGIQTQIALSIFVLAYSFGPFIVSPTSEIWGRVRVIQAGSMVFVVFNTACGFARTKGELTAFRFISGLLGSPTLGVCYCIPLYLDPTKFFRWVVR
jgi:MFS family permease